MDVRIKDELLSQVVAFALKDEKWQLSFADYFARNYILYLNKTATEILSALCPNHRPATIKSACISIENFISLSSPEAPVADTFSELVTIAFSPQLLFNLSLHDSFKINKFDVSPFFLKLSKWLFLIDADHYMQEHNIICAKNHQESFRQTMMSLQIDLSQSLQSMVVLNIQSEWDFQKKYKNLSKINDQLIMNMKMQVLTENLNIPAYLTNQLFITNIQVFLKVTALASASVWLMHDVVKSAFMKMIFLRMKAGFLRSQLANPAVKPISELFFTLALVELMTQVKILPQSSQAVFGNYWHYTSYRLPLLLTSMYLTARFMERPALVSPQFSMNVHGFYLMFRLNLIHALSTSTFGVLILPFVLWVLLVPVALVFRVAVSIMYRAGLSFSEFILSDAALGRHPTIRHFQPMPFEIEVDDADTTPVAYRRQHSQERYALDYAYIPETYGNARPMEYVVNFLGSLKRNKGEQILQLGLQDELEAFICVFSTRTASLSEVEQLKSFLYQLDEEMPSVQILSLRLDIVSQRMSPTNMPDYARVRLMTNQLLYSDEPEPSVATIEEAELFIVQYIPEAARRRLRR